MSTHTLYISYDECGQATPYCICIMYWCIRMVVFSWDSGVKGMANMPYSGPVNKSDPRARCPHAVTGLLHSQSLCLLPALIKHANDFILYD